MEKSLTYQDILLVPRYSELESRSQADTSVELLGWKFKLPIIPANMEDVINPKIAKYLSENGYFYIYHRFGNGILFNNNKEVNLNNTGFICLANTENWKLISISTGVNEDSLKDLEYIKKYNYRVDFITIDVAHGHHIKVKQRIEWIKENLPNTKVIAGNIATYQAYKDLAKWGADVIKIGIGQGSICTTRFQTGFSIPMFSCIRNISECRKPQFYSFGGSINIDERFKIWQEIHSLNIPIIADGGIQTIGDISKALVAGAKMVMSGKLFASCIDSPAKIIAGKKQYRGSTSFESKKENKHIEGKIINLEFNVKFEEKLEEIKQALQSSISYSGGKDLSAFETVEWIMI